MKFARAALAAALLTLAFGARAVEPAHGIAMHGPPALPDGFEHLPYANPGAPQGGEIAFGVVGGFDSLNPFILRGRAPWEIQPYTTEPLMGRNWDEPFGLYGLIAETITTPPDRSWVEFKLRPEARFSDGSPVTVEDVIWSMETRAEEGRPGFRAVWDKVASVERPGPGRVRFAFDAPDREAPLILGLAPILKKAQFEGRDFAEPSLEPLIGSGPYVVEDAEPGRALTLRRDRDWWGEGLALNAGQHNLDVIRVEYFRDAAALFDAFKAGEIDVFRDADPVRWAEGYDFPAAREGRVVRTEAPHGRPSGMKGLVFNTRRPPFDDRRVRAALALAFDFAWLNDTLFRGGYERIESYFDNSPLGHEGPATGREREILAPFDLPEGALDAAYEPPAGAGDGRNRRNLRRATQLLAEADWEVRDGALRDASGEPFRFEILLANAADEQVAGIYADALEALGIEARVRTVDAAQYQERRTDYDFDMIVNEWALSLSPGNEQRLYWGREGVTEPGSRNYMGVDDPAVEASIDALLAAESREDFEAAARALDRALAWGVYVVPFWRAPASWIAHDARLRHPERTPLYGDWIGWLPDVWWSEG